MGPVKPAPPTVDWDARLGVVDSALNDGDVEDAGKELAALEQSAHEFNKSQREKLNALQRRLSQERRRLLTARREKLLDAAQQAVDDGDLDAATRSLQTVLSISPTENQKSLAAGLQARIENIRKARRRLESNLRRLKNDNNRDFYAARSELLREPDVALPMVIEGTRAEDPTLVKNCLRMLRYFKQPQRVIPAIVAVLADPKQQDNWPTAVNEIERLDDPGAGGPLLDLALKTEASEQRSAVLAALSKAPDPPQQTLTKLLPVIYSAAPDDADLAAVLTAARKAARLHQQTDVVARRGISQLGEEQTRRLEEFPDRLKQIIDADTTDGRHGETARTAMSLGVALRLIQPRTLANIKLTRHSGEDPAAPAAAVVDGEWQSALPQNMWRHPRSGRPLVAFDLGEEFTVTGIRVWNYNEPNYTGRGWREVDVFTGPDPSLLTPVSSGVVPIAPGVSEAADYSIVLPVPFVRGRFVKLEPRSYWNTSDSVGGVTEIQVLGF